MIAEVVPDLEIKRDSRKDGPNTFGYVTAWAEEQIGRCGVKVFGEFAEIGPAESSLRIEDAYRGRGVAPELVTHAIDFAVELAARRGNKLTEVFLETRAHNTAGIRVAEKAGMKRTYESPSGRLAYSLVLP